MRADERRLVLLQAFNLLLMAVAAGVVAVGVRGAARLAAGPGAAPAPAAAGWVEPGVFGVLMALAGGLGSLVLAVVAFRRMARGELYAPLFTTLGWAVLWLPLAMALTMLMPASFFTPLIATVVCAAGIVLSLAVLGSRKPR